MTTQSHFPSWIAATSLSLGLVATACGPKSEPAAAEAQSAKGAAEASSKAEAEAEAEQKGSVDEPSDTMKGRFDADGQLVELPPIPEGPIATVGDVKISRDEFLELYNLKIRTSKGELLPAKAQGELRKSTVERFVMEEVLRQEAEQRGVKIDLETLAADEAKEKARHEDWAQRLAALRETEQSWHESNLTRARLEALLETGYQIGATEEELEKAYQASRKATYSKDPRVHAAHIMVQVGPLRSPDVPMPAADDATVERWKEQARARAKKLYRLAKAPDADFASLALQHSHDAATAVRGGDLGVFRKIDRRRRISLVAFSNRAGEVSDPFETELGWHVVKTYAKFPPGELPRDVLIENLREQFTTQRRAEAEKELFAELQTRHRVDVHVRTHMLALANYMARHLDLPGEAVAAGDAVDPAPAELPNDAVAPG